MTATVHFNGAFLSKAEVSVSPDDRGFLFGDGVYEVVRSYGGRIFALNEHIDRLRFGLREIAIAGLDAGSLGPVLAELLERNGLGLDDATIYLQVTRGSARRTHAFPDPPAAPTVYAAANRFIPPYDPVAGVRAITVPDVRWARCDIKSIQLLPNCMANQRARSAGAQEALFVRDGVALEGSHSNVFFVLHGEVRTAPRSNYILPGITREVVVELCRTAAIPLRETPVFAHELRDATEVFLAGTTMDVMPVVAIDGQSVADGKRGKLTARIQELLRGRTG